MLTVYLRLKPLFYLLFVSAFFISCGKSNTTSVPNAVDVSQQWKVDAVGNVIQSILDGQWQHKTFSSQEISLFSSLDTANLTGTVKPDSVFESAIRYNCIYPTPFASFYQFSFAFSNGFNGQMVYKYVIVDSLFNPLEKKTIRLQATSYPQIPSNPSSSNTITVAPNIPIGRFRLYYTLSSSSNPHFYKSWGNIQRTQ